MSPVPVRSVLCLDVSVASVFTPEALEQVVEHTGGYERLEAGEALQRAGRVTRAEPAFMGVGGTVQDDGAEHRVWVGIRQWMLVSECSCPDADPTCRRGSAHGRGPMLGHAPGWGPRPR